MVLLIGNNFIVGLIICSTIPKGEASRNDIHRMMYQSFENPMSCFRRLNGTHQFGCSSPRSGSFGVIHVIENQTDITWVIEKGLAGPYMVVLPPNYFTSEVMHTLASSPKVSGVLLIVRPEQRPEDYSPDDVCPNRYSDERSCILSKPWNPKGNLFLLKDWSIPIFTINNSTMIKTILNCHKKLNFPLDDSQTSRALCSLHMKAHMFAAVDSPTCIRRNSLVSFNPMKFCDPLADQNIYLSMGNPEWENKNVIVIAARLDSASLFDGIAPGAMSSVTGFVTLLTTANILYKQIQNRNTSKSLVFLLLNGEGFDYIGSSRVVYDMIKGRFPKQDMALKLEHLNFFIDISQLDASTDIYLHYYNESKEAKQFSEKMQNGSMEIGSKVTLNFTSVPSNILPPSSFHSFHKVLSSLPGVIINNFKSQFSNKYYNGLFDTSENLKYKYYNGSQIPQSTLQFNLAHVANSLAKTIFQIMTEEGEFNNEIPAELVDELLYCYLENNTCKVMQSLVGNEYELAPSPLPLYIGVGTSLNRITRLTGLLLASLTSPRINLTEAACAAELVTYKRYATAWIFGESECINTTLRFTPASSPAFEIEGYDWKSGEYSTWTESVWQDITLQMFIKPSRSQEIITLLCGLVTMLFSFIVVYWLTSRGQYLFLTPSPVSC